MTGTSYAEPGCTGDILNEITIIDGCNTEIVDGGINYGIDCESEAPAPTLEPTESPITIIGNDCGDNCQQDQICTYKGNCEDPVTEPDTPCDCDTENNYVCIGEANGGFCYYDECASVDSNGCSTTTSATLLCLTTTETREGANGVGIIEYESGVCTEVNFSASDGHRFIFAMIVSIIVCIVCVN